MSFPRRARTKKGPRGPYKTYLHSLQIPRRSRTLEEQIAFRQNQLAQQAFVAENSSVVEGQSSSANQEWFDHGEDAMASDAGGVMPSFPSTSCGSEVSRDRMNDFVFDFDIEAPSVSLVSDSREVHDVDRLLQENETMVETAPDGEDRCAGTSESNANLNDSARKANLPLDFEMVDKYGLNELVFPDSPLTKFEVLLMAITFSMRHGLTGVGLEDLLKLLNVILGEDTVPTSSFKIDRIFPSNVKFVVHFYCTKCVTYVGTKEKCQEKSVCPNPSCSAPFSMNNSSKNGNFFITIPVASQMKQLLEEPGVKDEIIDVKTREASTAYLSDIFDGIVYKRLVKEGIIVPGQTLTLTMNSDGSPVFKSAKNSLWPIQFRINELLPSVRFSSHRMLIAGLWFGKKDPVMATFLTPFIEEMKFLSDEGLNWTEHETGAPKWSKVLVIDCIADTVGRARLQNVMQFNGEYGCSYCYHPGDSVEGSTGTQKKYFPRQCIERSNCGVRRDMRLAQNSGSTVHGVKGLSALYSIPYFDVVWGYPIDAMHNAFLGTMRFLFSLWFDSENHEKRFYVKKQQQTKIDERLLSLKPPSNISRRPRSLSEYGHWKANEWRSFVFYYSFICLEGILEEQYFDHFCLFISAIYLLFQEKVSVSEIVQANDYLTEFVNRFLPLYGEENMRYNIHLNVHLARNVLHWGPAWTTIANSFETGNGTIVNLVKGTSNVLHQAGSKWILFSSISLVTTHHPNLNSATIKYCEDLMTYRRLKKVVSCDGATVVGYFKKVAPCIQGKEALRLSGLGLVPLLDSGDRVIFNGSRFLGNRYNKAREQQKRKLKFDDSLAKLESGAYCRINYFFRHPAVPKRLMFFGQEINLRSNMKSGTFAEKRGICIYNIRPCESDAFQNMKVYSVSSIKCKSVLMEVAGSHYVSDFPNSFEKD